MNPMKFSEMSYTRPDIDALLGQCKALAAKAAGAASGAELVNVYYEQSRAFADYSTAAQLASIHYTCDTRDAYWKAEQDFFDANSPAVENARVEISRAFLANAHVDALTEAFGTTCVAGMKNAVLGMDDRTVELQQQFNALASTTTASILTSGLLGEQYIGLTPGFMDEEMGTEVLKDGDRIEDTKSAIVLEDLIGKFLYSQSNK